MDSPHEHAMVALRRELHALPELSGAESGTAACLREFLLSCEPTRLLDNLGGHGLAAIFTARGGEPGLTIALRAELDALPIQERSRAPHASRRAGVAHACGHDGHLAALAGVAVALRERPLRRGRLVLLLQPAEETGEGARAVCRDPRWRSLGVDRCFALHNLPGYPLGQVLIREGVFTAGSVGLVIGLSGRTAHAAYPEQGLSPALAMSRLLPELVALPARLAPASDLALVTVVHARLGDVAFGTSPGQAEIMCTLRADSADTLQRLRQEAGRLAEHVAAADGLGCRLEWTDEFPVTENDDLAVAVVRQAAGRLALPVAAPAESPFRWSEDFGWFTREIEGALIGIGSGVQQPVLHAPDFDFPDALLPVMVQLYLAVLAELGLFDPA
ncbi:MAG: amidohydrolase [Candidatus Krumholzibacteriia bacterium]